MTLPELCIRRPVMTSLLMISFIIFGVFAYRLLPVAAIPKIDFPTIEISASLPGASPETMASSVATPIERQLMSIAGVDSITSSNTEGSSKIAIQFNLDRNIDGAALDVQTVLTAVAKQLPQEMPAPPTLQKVNPADWPVISLALSSRTLPSSTVNDFAENVIAPRLSTLPGVGQINIGGSQKYAVRIQLNPQAIAAAGIAIDDVRAAVAAANSNKPVGSINGDRQSLSLQASGLKRRAEDYRSLVVAMRNGAPVRLGDVARVIDSVENVRVGNWYNGKNAVQLQVLRQPDANLVQVVEEVKDILPKLKADLPASIELEVGMDRSQVIRASLHDVKITLTITVSLVILIIFLFLRNVTATMIPATALPVALIGTFAGMYLLGYSVDNLSLLAITLSVGFVVDDAIVMLENIVRHVEAGESPMQAALRGSREIGFTILSITLSLVAVFIPVLFMGGVVGRLFREFGVTISMTILISALVSLTLTPMLCSRILRGGLPHSTAPILRFSEAAFEWMRRTYERTLDLALRRQRLMLGITLASLVLSVALYVVVPKGFFPNEDTGFLIGSTEAGEDISYDAMVKLQQQIVDIVRRDPDITLINSTVGSNGPASGSNVGRLFIGLKPFGERSSSIDEIIQRLRPQVSQVPGIRVFLRPIANLSVGARVSKSNYQYTIQGTDFAELQRVALAMEARVRDVPGLQDLTSDLEVKRPQGVIDIDFDRAAALGVSADRIRDTLYTGYGNRQISTIYTANNTYQVIMEVDPAYQKDVGNLSSIYVRSTNGELVPLSAVTRVSTRASPLTINHQSQMPAVTLSFNLAPGTSLGGVVAGIEAVERDMNLPASITTGFQGNAQVFQDSLKGQGLLILAAVFVIYVVLGILYESYVHPITILSGLPSAGLGALLTLMLFRMDLSVISIIGVVMLIGIVKKNAIMMLDFALERQRADAALAPEDAIREACLLRFRPIMMTTFAGIFGILPIALGTGAGAELRQPLGVAVVGGLVFSQLLTLYITPVIYIYMERLRRRFGGRGGVPAKVAEIRPFVHAGE
jgi:HAE1 family hydrophobic/amphiphilic exporter-1